LDRTYVIVIFLLNLGCDNRKPEYQEGETTDMPNKSLTKLYHINLYLIHLTMGRNQTHNMSSSASIAKLGVNQSTINYCLDEPKLGQKITDL
jgi:hypothetical protein